MSRRQRQASVLEALARSRFLILLLCLLGLFLIQPMLPRGRGLSALDLDVALVAVLLASVWSLSHSRVLLFAGLALVVPAIAAGFFARVGPRAELALVGLGCALAFLVFAAGSVLWLVVRQREIDTDTILGGICVYLLLAAFWATLYSMMARIDPGSFSPATHPSTSPSGLLAPDLIYYSVLILTTMGPEDIVPISGPARAWTGLEAIAGQLYLAVFIARLVGMQSSQPRRGD